jgi:para-nitrobenzyl esterase
MKSATQGERYLPIETEIKVEGGRLRGVVDHGVIAFKGVPYASPPIGNRRFAPPFPVEPWTGVRDATEFAEPSLQAGFDIIDGTPAISETHVVGSEDCLYLNIYTPDTRGKHPVLVWMHGGGGMMGSGNNVDGATFAHNGIVVVTIAYRLGALGLVDLRGVFDELADSNFAILDQIAALRWVNQNIVAFGGDPEQVTLGGQSHGARSVGILLAAPHAAGLFSQAIMMSGTGVGHLVSNEEEAELVTSAVLNELHLESSSASRLRAIPANEIIAAQTRMAKSWPTILPFNALVGRSIVPERPIDAIKRGAATGIKILIGTTHDEFESFSLGNAGLGSFKSVMVDSETLTFATSAYRRILPSEWSDREVSHQVLTSSDWWIPAIRVAEAHASLQGVGWMYRFDWRLSPPGHGLGAPHGVDLAVITQPDPLASRQWPSKDDAPRFFSVIDTMRRAIVRFTSNQNPSSESWLPYEPSTRSTFLFDNGSHAERDPDAQLRLVWQDLL